MSEIYYVGIDLGTSRTSIATSTGVRLTTVTCAGYSKDVISRKRLGTDYLLGNQAIKNRLALDMIWPLSDGVISSNKKSLSTTKLILQDILKQAIPDKKKEDKLYVAIGAPAQASIQNKQDIIKITKGFLDKILIASEPFMVAYGLDLFDEALVIDLGGGTVDLCRIRGTMPTEEDQVTLKTAGNFLDAQIEKGILAKFPKVQLTQKIIQFIKEKYGYVGVSGKVMVTLTEKGVQKKYDMAEILKACCLKMTNPICKAVQKLVGEFDPDFQEALRNNIIVAGGGSRLKDVDKAIENQLVSYGGGSVTCVQDAEFSGANGALKMAVEMPDQYWERI